MSDLRKQYEANEWEAVKLYPIVAPVLRELADSEDFDFGFPAAALLVAALVMDNGPESPPKELEGLMHPSNWQEVHEQLTQFIEGFIPGC